MAKAPVLSEKILFVSSWCGLTRKGLKFVYVKATDQHPYGPKSYLRAEVLQSGF